MSNTNKRHENITVKYTETPVPEDIIIRLLCESIFKTAQKSSSKTVNSTPQKQIKTS